MAYGTAKGGNSTGPADVAVDVVAGVDFQRIKLVDGTEGSTTAITQPLTDTQLRASAVPVSGTVATGGLTDTELRASPVPVSGTVTASGPLTDTQLRASAVPVSGPLTDTQIRATALPVSGTVTATGPLTDTQLRASAVPVSLAAAPSTAVTNAGTFAVQADTELPSAAALADGASATPTTVTVGAVPLLMNATTEDRQRAVVAALDSTGTGIAAAGLMGQLDDVSTSTVTENQFAPVRISSRRAMLVEGVASGTAVIVNNGTAANLKVDASGVAVPVTDNSGSLTVDNGGTFAVQATIAAGATAIAKAEDVPSADADVGVPAMAIQKATPADTAGTDGDYAMLQMSAGRLWVSANGTVTANPTRPATPTQTSVASSASNVTVLASNTARLGATVFNDSTQVLYLKLGATASTTSYAVQIPSNGYYEIPFGYTGICDGIWASANGNARVTELAA